MTIIYSDQNLIIQNKSNSLQYTEKKYYKNNRIPKTEVATCKSPRLKTPQD